MTVCPYKLFARDALKTPPIRAIFRECFNMEQMPSRVRCSVSFAFLTSVHRWKANMGFRNGATLSRRSVFLFNFIFKLSVERRSKIERDDAHAPGRGTEGGRRTRRHIGDGRASRFFRSTMRASTTTTTVVDLTSPSSEPTTTTAGRRRRRRSGTDGGDEDARGVRRGGLDVGVPSAENEGGRRRRQRQRRGNDDDDDDDVCVVERPTAPLDVVFTGEKSPKRPRRALSARGERRERALRKGVFQQTRKAGCGGGNATTTGKGKGADGNGNATAAAAAAAAAGNGGGNNNLGRCAVCLEAYVNPTSTRCGHVFCARCIAAAIKHNGTCPTCRKRTTKAQCLRVYL